MRQTFFAIPSLRYEFTKDMYLELLYDYAATQYNLSDTNATAQSGVSCGFIFSIRCLNRNRSRFAIRSPWF